MYVIHFSDFFVIITIIRLINSVLKQYFRLLENAYVADSSQYVTQEDKVMMKDEFNFMNEIYKLLFSFVSKSHV